MPLSRILANQRPQRTTGDDRSIGKVLKERKFVIEMVDDDGTKFKGVDCVSVMEGMESIEWQ